MSFLIFWQYLDSITYMVVFYESKKYISSAPNIEKNV